MRRVVCEGKTFPEVTNDELLGVPPEAAWHVVCGDKGHWRLGMYSPELTSREEIQELEKHSCPELFVLQSGRVTLVLSGPEGTIRELPLELHKPVLVTAPHSAFCPGGPQTGVALVVERDAFETEYRPPEQW